MNEAQLDSLYRNLATDQPDALGLFLNAFADSDSFIRDAAAYLLIELIDADRLSAEQVAVVRAADWSKLDAKYERAYLDAAVSNFTRRNELPCPDCGRMTCTHIRTDADSWYCVPDEFFEVDFFED